MSLNCSGTLRRRLRSGTTAHGSRADKRDWRRLFGQHGRPISPPSPLQLRYNPETTTQKPTENAGILWWRRGESECSGLLKTRKLQENRPAKNARYCKIAPNWPVSGTRDSHLLSEIQLRRFTLISESPTTRPEPSDASHR